MEKYEKDGKVAILVSSGYGAGWSTWCGSELAYDKRVVEFFLEHKDDIKYLKALDSINKTKERTEAEELFESWGYDSVYFGGFDQIRIKWLPKGTKFRVVEYDGSESIETIDDIDWSVA